MIRAKPTMEWGKPPKNACKRPTRYLLVLQALSEHPQRWARLRQGTFEQVEAVRKRLNFVAGLNRCEVEVTCRSVDGKGRRKAVWARWIDGPKLDFKAKLPKLVWHDPPKGKQFKNREYKVSRDMDIARALVARPGEWARIKEATPNYNAAYGRAVRVRYAVARLNAEAEATVTCSADGYEAWARCAPQDDA